MQPRRFNHFRPKNNISSKLEELFADDVWKNNQKFDYTKYAAYIVPALIFLGVSKLSFYYSYFNIRILYFLDFGEIITSFFDFIINILVIAFAVLAFGSIAFIIFQSKQKRKLLIISCTYLAFIVLFILGTKAMHLEYLGVVIVFSSPLFALTTYIIHMKSMWEKSRHQSLDMLGIGVALFLIIVAIWYSAYHDYNRVRNLKRYLGVKVIYQDSNMNSFISDSTTYYIGNTSNYLFIYNQKEDKTVVEKINDIKSIEFPKRPETDRY